MSDTEKGVVCLGLNDMARRAAGEGSPGRERAGCGSRLLPPPQPRRSASEEESEAPHVPGAADLGFISVPLQVYDRLGGRSNIPNEQTMVIGIFSLAPPSAQQRQKW